MKVSPGDSPMPRTIEKLFARSTQLAAFALAVCTVIAAQTPAAPARVGGTITAINGDTLTVKPDNGDVRQVQVPPAAVLKRVEPGEKDLTKAETIQLTDLATGDRVLVRLAPNATGDTPQAAQIITIKAADVAQKQQQEREEWARSSVGGLAKSVDAGVGVVVLTTG